MRLIHSWKDYKIYLIKPDHYLLKYHGEILVEGSADKIKSKLNGIINLYHNSQNIPMPSDTNSGR